MNPGTSVHLTILKGVEAGAERAGAKVLRVDARTMDEVEQGFTLMPPRCQSQDRRGAGPDRTADAARSRRRGDRLNDGIFVGCSNGNSAGLAPFKILST